MTQQRSARFAIDHSDPAYPKLKRYKGIGIADNITSFNTLGDAKKALMDELVSMKDHYQGLINDVRKTTIKLLDNEAYPNLY